MATRLLFIIVRQAGKAMCEYFVIEFCVCTYILVCMCALKCVFAARTSCCAPLFCLYRLLLLLFSSEEFDVCAQKLSKFRQALDLFMGTHTYTNIQVCVCVCVHVCQTLLGIYIGALEFRCPMGCPYYCFTRFRPLFHSTLCLCVNYTRPRTIGFLQA